MIYIFSYLVIKILFVLTKTYDLKNFDLSLWWKYYIIYTNQNAWSQKIFIPGYKKYNIIYANRNAWSQNFFIPGDENMIYITKMFILSERVIPEPSDVGLPPAVRLWCRPLGQQGPWHLPWELHRFVAQVSLALRGSG